MAEIPGLSWRLMRLMFPIISRCPPGCSESFCGLLYSFFWSKLPESHLENTFLRRNAPTGCHPHPPLGPVDAVFLSTTSCNVTLILNTPQWGPNDTEPPKKRSNTKPGIQRLFHIRGMGSRSCHVTPRKLACFHCLL